MGAYTTTVRDAIINRSASWQATMADAWEESSQQERDLMTVLALEPIPGVVSDLTVSDDLTVQDDLSVAGDSALTGAVTFGDTVSGVTYLPYQATATATGATTGTIPDGTNHVTVTSDDANKIIILPTSNVGHEIWIHNGATGYELRSSTPASIAINGGTGADAESAIAANSTCVLRCVTTTAWKGFFMDADGDLAKIEAAAP